MLMQIIAPLLAFFLTGVTSLCLFFSLKNIIKENKSNLKICTYKTTAIAFGHEVRISKENIGRVHTKIRYFVENMERTASVSKIYKLGKKFKLK